MTKPNPRKTLEEVLDIEVEVEINQDHTNDWHWCDNATPFKELLKLLPEDKIFGFNITAAISAPKSIRWRQRDSDFDGGRRGDYLFVDRNGGKMALPYKIFKRLF